LTVVTSDDSGAGNTGDGPKPVSVELDGPAAHAASGSSMNKTKRFN
jgi:hypothetical protein